MNRIATFLTLAAALAVVCFVAAPPPAYAADVWKAALTSNDAGTTNSVLVGGGITVALQCDNPACYKASLTTPITADCSKDWVLQPSTSGSGAVMGTFNLLTFGGGDGGLTAVSLAPVPVVKYQKEFDMGGLAYVAAFALDGGNPACDVYTVVKNKAQ